MRTSQYLLSTLKETPSDAEITSHQLMLRAGMIRKLASGMYAWLPSGLRVLKNREHRARRDGCWCRRGSSDAGGAARRAVAEVRLLG
jgi:hypothetical protein